MKDEPELYDTTGRRVMTDGGTTVAGQSGGPTGPAQNNPWGEMQGQSGDGFEQFTALSTKHSAPEGSKLQANAAKQAAQFRANATLRKDEWKTLDERLIEIAQENLVLVNDLRSRGLTVNEDLATLIREWETTNEFSDADVDMSGESSGSDDVSTFTLNGTPLPIVHKSFHVKRRQLLASRRRGQALDMTNQSKAARKVMEGLEDMTIDGWGGTVDGYQVYGFRNHPDRNQVAGTDWSAATDPAATARDDILSTVEAIENADYGGSQYVLGVNRTQWQELRRFDTGTDEERGVLERLRNEFGDTIDMMQVPRLPNGEAIMYRPVQDVVELANASDIQNVEWESPSGWTSHMKVMASMTPIIKSDDTGASGVAHLTGI